MNGRACSLVRASAVRVCSVPVLIDCIPPATSFTVDIL